MPRLQACRAPRSATGAPSPAPARPQPCDPPPRPSARSPVAARPPAAPPRGARLARRPPPPAAPGWPACASACREPGAGRSGGAGRGRGRRGEASVSKGGRAFPSCMRATAQQLASHAVLSTCRFTHPPTHPQTHTPAHTPHTRTCSFSMIWLPLSTSAADSLSRCTPTHGAEFMERAACRVCRAPTQGHTCSRLRTNYGTNATGLCARSPQGRSHAQVPTDPAAPSPPRAPTHRLVRRERVPQLSAALLPLPRRRLQV